MLSEPLIVCAAVRLTGTDLIVCSPRHFDPLAVEVMKHIFIEGDKYNTWEHGFVDQHRVFYNRQDAWKVAMKQNQIRKRVGGDQSKGGTLYSENLY